MDGGAAEGRGVTSSIFEHPVYLRCAALGAQLDQIEAERREAAEWQAIVESASKVAGGVVEGPRVSAACDRLAQIPDEWVSEALAESVVRRAVCETVVERLAECLAEARGEADRVAQAVLAGEEPPDALVAAHVRLLAAGSARDAIGVPQIDAEEARAALVKAHGALQEAMTVTIPRLDFESETDLWVQTCERSRRTLMPPVPTDEDRRLAPVVSAARGRYDTWCGYVRAWWTDAQGAAGDPLSFLGAAGGLLKQGDQIAVELAQLVAPVEAANGRRAASGLTWTVAGAQVATRHSIMAAVR